MEIVGFLMCALSGYTLASDVRNNWPLALGLFVAGQVLLLSA